MLCYVNFLFYEQGKLPDNFLPVGQGNFLFLEQDIFKNKSNLLALRIEYFFQQYRQSRLNNYIKMI